MTTLEKAFWSLGDDDSIKIGLPIQKVDKERRIVSGWATTDTLDKHGDIIEIEASEEAFRNFIGNVREMHQPIAAGKVVDARRDTYFDKESGEFHNGMYVDVYISKGAESTWEKVCDGTLTGFSIGGHDVKAVKEYNKAAGAVTRKVKGYKLRELSLVDDPANNDSVFVSLQKFADQEPELEKNYLETVFFCDTDQHITVSKATDSDCAVCRKPMTNIGFVETSDIEKAAEVATLVKLYTENPKEQEENNMGLFKDKDDLEKSADAVAEVTEEAAVEEVVEAEAPAEEAVEDAVEAVVEVEAVDEVIEAAPAEDSELVKANDASLVEAVGALTTLVTALGTQVSELQKSFASTSEATVAAVASAKDELVKFGGRVDALEGETALRKSGDLGGIEQDDRIEKSATPWGGRFLDANHIYS